MAITRAAVIVHDEIVRAKLLAAAPRILAHNRTLVEAMLREVKTAIIPQTPLGPGHFGYHLRDTYSIDLSSEGIATKGVLKSAVQGYWREYGTRGNFKKGGTILGFANAFENLAGLPHPRGEGERALMIAHKALNAVRRLIRFYYGGAAAWWRL